jgi:hypothetical protein
VWTVIGDKLGSVHKRVEEPCRSSAKRWAELLHKASTRSIVGKYIHTHVYYLYWLTLKTVKSSTRLYITYTVVVFEGHVVHGYFTHWIAWHKKFR